jgi:molybdate transport system regulatory protein
MKYGARNQIIGKVAEIKKDAVMCEVKVEIAGPSHMASVMTVESLHDMDIKPGDHVKVIVKAVHVLLVKE